MRVKNLEKIFEKPYLIVIAMVFLAFLIHLIYSANQNGIERDSVIYVRMAEEIVNQDTKRCEIGKYIPPLLPAAMAFGHRQGMDIELSGILFVMITASLLPLSLFMIGKEVFKDDRPALLGAFLGAIHPYFIKTGSEILRDAPYWCFFSFALAFALIGIRHRTSFRYLWYWALTAFFTALAVLTRKEGAELIIFMLLWIPFELFIYRHEFKRELLRIALTAIVFIVIFCAITIPFRYFYQKYFGGYFFIIDTHFTNVPYAIFKFLNL